MVPAILQILARPSIFYQPKYRYCMKKLLAIGFNCLSVNLHTLFRALLVFSHWV